MFFADTSQLISIPRIVIVIDELQDLMTTIKADAESVLREIALKGSKAGIYMIAATQNFQIEKSLNNLFPSLAYLSVKQQYMIDLRILHNEAINARLPIVEWNNILEMIAGLKEQDSLAYSKDIFDELDKHSNSQCQENESEFDDDDEILTQAIECVIESGQASTSQLQRRLKLGYARAARIIDQLEGKGIVGPFEGSKPRQVLISKDKWLEMKSGGTQGLPGFECEVTAKVKKEVISKANAGGNEPPLIDWNDNDKLDSEDIAMSLALSDDDKNASSPKQKGKPSSGCLVSILTFIGVMVFLIMWLI